MDQDSEAEKNTGSQNPQAPLSPEPAPAAASAPDSERERENDLLTAGASLLEHPKVKTYIGRMSKIMVLFAILGCLMMIAAVTAITSLFNSIVPN
ncbi:MAG TPA: hypothetical protein PLC15_04860 [Candidatus Obscuribacter sp.]|nr:hypothetical protein [Candidatus Obscuribacter sp.]MBK9282421.1 hypothetical protein [Candidatus Obscuribacter sp.]MBL8083747.1 hypothetical protein [Candidatus Obscuribacter sp.]HMW89932.1 hypothetical protein [Candidatus Obscuribacter sp.]HMX44873.1 hypothetical protein [Candidatus Obscuribacter sp.]